MLLFRRCCFGENRNNNETTTIAAPHNSTPAPPFSHPGNALASGNEHRDVEPAAHHGQQDVQVRALPHVQSRRLVGPHASPKLHLQAQTHSPSATPERRLHQVRVVVHECLVEVQQQKKLGQVRARSSPDKGPIPAPSKKKFMQLISTGTAVKSFSTPPRGKKSAYLGPLSSACPGAVL